MHSRIACLLVVCTNLIAMEPPTRQDTNSQEIVSKPKQSTHQKQHPNIPKTFLKQRKLCPHTTTSLCSSLSCKKCDTFLLLIHRAINYIVRSTTQGSHYTLPFKSSVHNLIQMYVLDSSKNYAQRLHAFFMLKDKIPESTGLYLESDKTKLIKDFIQDEVQQYTVFLRKKSLEKFRELVTNKPFLHACIAISIEEKQPLLVALAASLVLDRKRPAIQAEVNQILVTIQQTHIDSKKYRDAVLQEIHTALHKKPICSHRDRYDFSSTRLLTKNLTNVP